MTVRVEPSGDACGLRVGFVSDPGRVRERNEDAYALHLAYRGEKSGSPVDAYFAVADGMGGHERGDLASRYITEAVGQELGTAGPGFPETPAEFGPWLRGLVHRINSGLIQLGEQEAVTRSMGSTLTLAVIWRRTLFLGHVGDTRCYRLRAGALRQLTEDHSWVAEQRRAGLLTEAEAAKHPNRNWLTQCLGIDTEPDVFLLEQPLLDGDRYLLCSDGLHGEIADTQLATILRDEQEPQAAARRLLEAANLSGGPDNITAIVFDASVPLEKAPPPPVPPLRESSLAATLPGLELPAVRRGRGLGVAGLFLLLATTVAVFGAWLIGGGRSVRAMPGLEATTFPADSQPMVRDTPAPATTAPPPEQED